MPAGWASQINTTNAFGTNDTIQFDSSLATHTITLDGAVLPNLSANMTITGPTGGIILDAAQNSQIMDTDATISISGLTFAHGDDTTGGGIYTYIDTTLTLTGCTFSDNTGTDWGGGIENYGTLIATNCIFTGNYGR